MKIKNNTQVAALRLDPRASTIVAGFAALTGRSAPQTASLFITLTERLMTKQVTLEQAKAHIDGLCQIEAARKKADALLTAARRSAHKLPPSPAK